MEKQAQTEVRYFIRDCEGSVIGNLKGYRTYGGAMRQHNSAKLQALIYQRYYERKITENNLLSTVRKG